MRSTILAALMALALLSATMAVAVGRDDQASAIEQAFTSGDVSVVRDVYERMLESGKSLDRYLRAYAGWRLVQMDPNLSKKDKKKILKSARKDLDQFLKTEPDNVEGLALRGGVTGEMITGAFSGMTLGPKVGRDLDKALQLAPDNPRVALIRGVNFHFTPSTFGGGDDKAEAELRRARELFEELEASGWPDWGQIDALGWLGQVLAAQDRIQEALVIFDEALTLSADHQWIKQLRTAAIQASRQTK